MMLRKIFAGLMFGWAGAALADDADLEDPRWYVSPMVGYLKTDSDRCADNEVNGYLGLGKPLSEHVNIEMYTYGANVSVDPCGRRTPTPRGAPAGNSGGQQQWRGGGVSGLYVLSRNPGFSPYAVIGGSGMRTEFDGDSTFNPVAEAGAGFFSQVLGDASLRADVRQRFVFDNDTVAGESRLDDVVASVGISIPLGEKPSRPAPVAEAPAPAPAPEPEPQPKTIKETVILDGVNFCFDCYLLSDQAKSILDTNARKVIEANIDNDIELAGHTDSIGAEDYNEALSQRRVDSVREYLVSQGVDGAKLSARGYGESQPIADNATAEGRARNRRVEVRVME